MDVSSKDPRTPPPVALLVSQAPAVPPRYRRHFRRQPLESGILMLYGNARRHRHIGEAGIEEMETRKHSSSLLRIQAYAPSDLHNYFRLIALFELQFKPIQDILQFAFVIKNLEPLMSKIFHK